MSSASLVEMEFERSSQEAEQMTLQHEERSVALRLDLPLK
jgi:hypothetical protein